MYRELDGIRHEALVVARIVALNMPLIVFGLPQIQGLFSDQPEGEVAGAVQVNAERRRFIPPYVDIGPAFSANSDARNVELIIGTCGAQRPRRKRMDTDRQDG